MTKSKSDSTDRIEKKELSKKTIIRSSREIGDVLRRGRRIMGKHASFIYAFSRRPEGIRVAFATSRKAKRAVDRNRLKRLMRESFRLNLNRLRAFENYFHIDLVLYGNQASAFISLKDIEKDFEEFLLRLSEKVAE